MVHPIESVTNKVTDRRTEDNVLPVIEADIRLRPENRKGTDKAFICLFLTCIIIAILQTIIVFASNSSSLLGFSKFHQIKFEFCISGWELALTFAISLGLTLIVATLCRYATYFMVWSLLIISSVCLSILAIAVWFILESMALKLIVFFVSTLLLCLEIFMRDRIHLATMLFKESTKATFHMKAIFSVGGVITVLLLLLLVMIIYGLTTFGILSSNVSIASAIFDTITTIWILEFLISIQYLIISGAVTKWYLTRNKDLLGDPVYTSFGVTLKYHTGTVALGSLIITIIDILLIVIIIKLSRFWVFVICCCRPVAEFILTKNTFIVTAMHGTPFIQSVKQAVKLLELNICNTVIITCLGEFVLMMSGVLIVGLSLVISYFVLNLDNNCLKVVAGISLLCCCPVLLIFKTSFSTLFLCTCQDYLINNGNNKPYALTRDLMEFLEGSKKVFAKTKKNQPKV